VRFPLWIPHSATHLGFCVTGSTIFITWSDRQNVIRTGGFDIVNNLPHFLLVLLIIQRFDLARWGFFTAFKGSNIYPIRDKHSAYVLEATFIPNTKIQIFLQDDPTHSGINLTGRSTGTAGAKAVDGQDTAPSECIRDSNDLIVKFSWPEETRVSEAEIIEQAKQIGKNNRLVKDRIPTMLGSIDPPYLTCSTSLIRKFLGLDPSGARVLRIIVFRRLKELRYLDEDDMLIAFLDTFFSKFISCLFCYPPALIPAQVTGLCGTRESSTGTSA